MSAPLLGANGTTSASGLEDGFGRRQLAFTRDDGAMFELLHLRPEFTIYERALHDTFARIAAHPQAGAGGRIVAPRMIERDAETGGLVAVSEFIRGERLADLLDTAAERSRDDDAVTGMDAALGFLLDVLPALGALRAASGISHGAIAPTRCVFTPDGRVVLTESGFAPVLQRLNLGRQRLWRNFRVAMPPAAGAARFDETADISQAALAAVMLVLGRPFGEDDPVDVLPEWLADVMEIAQIRGSVTFAVNLQRFLQRALPLPGRRPYMTLDAALHDVGQLAEAIGVDLCRASISGSVRHAAAARGDAPAVAAAAADEWRQVDLGKPAETVPLRIVEEPAIQVPEEPVREPLVPEPLFEPFVEDPVAAVEAPVAEREWAQPVGVMPAAPEPIVSDPIVTSAPEPLAADPIATSVPAPEPLAAGPVGTSAPEPIAPEPFAPIAVAPIAAEHPAAATSGEPETPAPDSIVNPAAVARRRRARSKRQWADALRSAVTRAPSGPEPKTEPASPVAEPTPPAPSPVVTPVPFAAPPPPTPSFVLEPLAQQPLPPAPQPLVPQPIALQHLPAPPVPPLTVAPAPVVPQPVFAPLAAPVAERLWEPPLVVEPAPAVPIAPKPISLAQVTPGPIKVKSKPVAAARRPVNYEPLEPAQRYAVPGDAAGVADRGRSWKFAAAAAFVIITVAAVARVYLPDNSALNAESTKRQAPVTVTAPPPVTTGTIVAQTQPEGARVLLDGSPAGETPLRIVDVAPGRHVLTFVTPTATIKRTVKVESNKTVTLNIPVFSGWVAIFAPLVLEVSEQGRAIGTTDQGRLLLAPGRHTLTLANREFGYSADHAVEIEAGEVRSLNIQPKGTLNLNADPWAEVWINGRKAGDTPIANLELPLGNIEITFKHPEFGERKVTTRVSAGAPVAVSVDFSK